jgi:hypothetical protein
MSFACFVKPDSPVWASEDDAGFSIIWRKRTNKTKSFVERSRAQSSFGHGLWEPHVFGHDVIRAIGPKKLCRIPTSMVLAEYALQAMQLVSAAALCKPCWPWLQYCMLTHRAIWSHASFLLFIYLGRTCVASQ